MKKSKISNIKFYSAILTMSLPLILNGCESKIENEEQVTSSINYDCDKFELCKTENLLAVEEETILSSDKSKVYLVDEYKNRLSIDFDQLIPIEMYRYYSIGLSNYENIVTNKEREYLIGKTLRTDLNGNTLNYNITLLDYNGTNLYSFNGVLKALIDNTMSISLYSENGVEEGYRGSYLYDFKTKTESEKHDAIFVYKYTNKNDEEKCYFIGVDLFGVDKIGNHVYYFYDENMDILKVSTTEEIDNWGYNNCMYDGDVYNNYYDYIYENIESDKNMSDMKLLKK